MSDTRKEVFKNIHERCFQFGSCNYKETGCSDCPIHITLVKAETLLDKEEQGLLIELPVTEGTGVWTIVTGMTGKHPTLFRQDFELSMLKHWGTAVFLTRSEAEEALAKMKEED